MIAQLSGQLKHVGDDTVVLDVGGVGYYVHCTSGECDRLRAHKGRDLILHTHHHVRDNAIELYGFSKTGERDMFRILIGISGIGPKGALGILNVSSPDVLQKAIAGGDTSVLTKVSGIGERIAQKIVMELKDKFGAQWEDVSADGEESRDAIEALESLGYSQHQAQNALRQVPIEVTSMEGKIKAALKVLSNK